MKILTVRKLYPYVPVQEHFFLSGNEVILELELSWGVTESYTFNFGYIF